MVSSVTRSHAPTSRSADAATAHGCRAGEHPAWSEPERLAALDRYAILDTPPEPPFDDLVELAADICETPIALMTLVAKDRQWFKAVKGLAFHETPINESVCVQLLHMPDVTVIPDLTADERFACNPLVMADRGLRFYAGALLETPERLPLGTLCVLDTVPRPEGLSEWQRRALATLAAQAIDSLELRRLHAGQAAARRRESEAAKRRERVVLASLSDGVFALDRHLCFTLFNRAAEIWSGRSEQQLLGKPFSTLFPTGANLFEERIREVMETETAKAFEAAAITRPGRYLRVRLAPMDGGVAGSFADITEEKRAREAQQTLIAELQHRTRNLLAIVSSIAGQTLQSSSTIATFAAQFNGRLAALSRAQTLLSEGSGHSVALDELVRGELIAHGADIDGDRIRVGGPAIELPSTAVQVLSLALHELATNALKYGALLQRKRLSVSWQVTETDDQRRVTLDWIEDGVRMPDDQAENRRGFGRQLIERALPYDLGAKTRFELTPRGVHCRITIRAD